MAIKISGTTIVDDFQGLRITGVSTFTNQGGPVLIGSGTSTGTASQLQVFGSASFTGINSSVGIGTTNPTGANLYVVPTSTSIAGLFSGSTSGDLLRITQLGTGNAILIEDSANPDTSPFIITGIGSVGIGTTRPTENLQVVGNILASGNVTGYSDEKLKDNIKTISNALDKIIQIRGVEYDRKDIKGNPHHIGVIAQEIEKIIPEVVSTHSDGIKSVAYGNLIGIVIEAIKEQQHQINNLKEEIENLRN